METGESTHTWRTLTKMVVKIGKDDPRRIIYSIKYGLALVLAICIRYFRSFVFDVNIALAVFTAALVQDFYVGSTVVKSLNRVMATTSGIFLAVAVREMTSFLGEKDIMTLVFVFFVGGMMTYMRFFPRLNPISDSAFIVFILAFCLESLMGSSEIKLLEVAGARLLMITIGSVEAIMVCIIIYPFWNGGDLHNESSSNIEKLADLLEGFRGKYFDNLEDTAEAEDDDPCLSILSSKTNEETMAFFARWEPCHGRFKFRHPWKQYLMIGNKIRSCASKIHALSDSHRTPYEIRSRIEEPCTNIIVESGKALRESSWMLNLMAKSAMPNLHVANAESAAKSLISLLGTNPWDGADVVEILPAITVASHLKDVVLCVKEKCEAVEELANLASFAPSSEVFHGETVQPISDNDGSIAVITERI